MPFMTGHTFLTLLITALGAGLFLRLVAKEKRRREKHLEHRLIEKVKKLEEEAKRKREQHIWQPEEETVLVPVAAEDGSPGARAGKAAA